MNFSKKLLLLPLLAIFFASCLNTTQQDNQNNQLVLTLELTDINNEIVSGEDTVNIGQLRFLYGETDLRNSNDTLVINENILQITHQFTNDELKGLARGTFESDEIFNRLIFEIKKAELSDTGQGSNFDEDAFIEGESEDQRYSMIIDGSYNGNEFTYKSTRNFDFEFNIQDDSDGAQGSLLYSLPVKAEVSFWFLNENGDGLLDPRVADNASAINENIQQSFNLN